MLPKPAGYEEARSPPYSELAAYLLCADLDALTLGRALLRQPQVQDAATHPCLDAGRVNCVR
jgi:hypothetical protein